MLNALVGSAPAPSRRPAGTTAGTVAPAARPTAEPPSTLGPDGAVPAPEAAAPTAPDGIASHDAPRPLHRTSAPHPSDAPARDDARPAGRPSTNQPDDNSTSDDERPLDRTSAPSSDTPAPDETRPAGRPSPTHPGSGSTIDTAPPLGRIAAPSSPGTTPRDDRPPAPSSDHATGTGAALEVSGLARAYGGKTVLSGIDLSVRPGEFVAVVGRSGCGKSTLLRLLLGLEAPDAGAVRIDGAPAPRAGGDVARFVFQEPRLLPWQRVLDNVALGASRRVPADERRRLAGEALQAVGLGDRGGEWPSVLSGGQRQRVALARALVSHPRLLALDEPLGALDALTRIDMQDFLERVWRREGFTAVLVTHDVAEAVALADRIVLIDEGRIALDIPVPLPRPRQRGSAAFGAIEAEVLGHLFGRRTTGTPA